MNRKILGITLAILLVIGSAIGVYAYTRTDSSWYAQYEDTAVSEGVVIYLGVQGYDEAYSQLDVTPGTFWEAELDGVATTDWVADYICDQLERYLTVEALFDDEGLTLSEEDLEEIEDTVYEDYWYYGRRAIYGPMGVHEEDFTDLVTNDKKAELLLAHYGDELEAQISDEDLRQALSDNYASFIYISVSYFINEDGDSSLEEYEELCRQVEAGEITVEELAELYSDRDDYPYMSTSLADDGRIDACIPYGTTKFPVAFQEELFAAEDGDVIYYDDTANFNYTISQRTDLLRDDYFVEQYRDELLQLLLAGELDLLLAERADDFDLTVNRNAVGKLDLEEIMAQA